MNYHMLILAFINNGLPEKDAWEAAFSYKDTVELLNDLDPSSASQEDYNEGVMIEMGYWEN